MEATSSSKYSDQEHYLGCRRRARYRRIEFLLTFEDWLNIWKDSGHYHERGCFKGQYVMARYGDIGPYAINNVKIIPSTENVREAQLGKVVSKNTRKKIAAARTGKKRAPFSEEWKRNMGANHRSRRGPQSLQERQKRSETITKIWAERSARERARIVKKGHSHRT